jgi:hypothetical protein
MIEMIKKKYKCSELTSNKIIGHWSSETVGYDFSYLYIKIKSQKND